VVPPLASVTPRRASIVAHSMHRLAPALSVTLHDAASNQALCSPKVSRGDADIHDGDARDGYGNRIDTSRARDDLSMRAHAHASDRKIANDRENITRECSSASKRALGDRARVGAQGRAREPLTPLANGARASKAATPLRRARTLVEAQLGEDLRFSALDRASVWEKGKTRDEEARATRAASTSGRERERELVAYMNRLAAIADEQKKEIDEQKKEIEDLLDALAASEIEAEETRDALEFAVLLESRDRAKFEALAKEKDGEIERMRAQLEASSASSSPRAIDDDDKKRQNANSRRAKFAASNLRAEVRAVIEAEVRSEIIAELMRGAATGAGALKSEEISKT